MSSECAICNKKNSKIMIKDDRFTVKEDRSCIVCTDCFNLWASGDDNQLYKRLHKKLIGGVDEGED